MRDLIEKITNKHAQSDDISEEKVRAKDVRVREDMYIRSHGKPKGEGQWMFGFGPGAGSSKDYLDSSKRDKTWFRSPFASYGKAKTMAKKLAASLGFTEITTLP